MPEQKEVEEKLHDLNLTTLASARQEKIKWFRENKINILEIETYYYLVPADIENAEDVLYQIHRANIYLQNLSMHLDWLKANNIVVKLKTEPRREYIFVGKKNSENTQGVPQKTEAQ